MVGYNVSSVIFSVVFIYEVGGLVLVNVISDVNGIINVGNYIFWVIF